MIPHKVILQVHLIKIKGKEKCICRLIVFRLLDFSDAETGEQIQIQEDKVVESEGLNPKASKLSESVQDRVIEIERNLPMDKDFDFTYEVNPVVRRFFIKNESPFTIYGQFAIVPKSNNFLNFRIPCSFFNLSLKPHSNNCVLTIAKIFPSLGWGDYEVKFYMFERDSNQDKDHNEKKESFLTKILNSKREQFTQDRLIVRNF